MNVVVRAFQGLTPYEILCILIAAGATFEGVSWSSNEQIAVEVISVGFKSQQPMEQQVSILTGLAGASAPIIGPNRPEPG